MRSRTTSDSTTRTAARGSSEDNDEFLENYKRIVRLIGRTFRDMGIEVLLHNLANPAKSICAIEGGDVTGRALELGTTSLVIDLKKRRLLNQDKLNYELNIGARRFKCTTIPIYRREFGLVAALCVNIDINYVRDEVKSSPRAHRGVPGEVRANGNAARGEHPEPRGVRAGHQRQAALAGRGSAWVTTRFRDRGGGLSRVPGWAQGCWSISSRRPNIPAQRAVPCNGPLPN